MLRVICKEQPIIKSAEHREPVWISVRLKIATLHAAPHELLL